MNTKILKKPIATLLALLLVVVGIVIPITTHGIVAIADDDIITGDFSDNNFIDAILEEMPEGETEILASVVEQITSLDVSGKNIANLAGIEHFTNLEELIANNNQLTALDISSLSALRTLNVAGNSIASTELTFGTTHPNLEELDLSGNRISTFDMRIFPNIKALNLSNNNVTSASLTLGHSATLESLDLSENRIHTFDMRGLPVLKTLNLSNNILPSASLTLGSNDNLESLNLSGNRLTTININGFPRLQNLDISQNQFTTFTLNNHANIEVLNLLGNRLTTLNISALPSLQHFDVSRNALTSLNVSAFPTLISLDAALNQLTALTLGTQTHMTNLHANNNRLTSLDVSTAAALKSLIVGTNRLTTINVSNLEELRFLDIARNELISTAMIIGLENTMIDPETEGDSWVTSGVRYGFYFNPQNVRTSWPFVDVPHTAWFYMDVFWAYSNNVTRGIAGTNPPEFRPTHPVTRGQFVSFLYRIEGEPDVQPGHSFTDVPAGRYFTIPVTWAVNNGVTTGFAGTTEFRPNSRISREQIVTMLYRYVDNPVAPANALDGFVDAGAISPWALNAMRWAVDQGLIQGNRGRLLPQNDATRAETVAILNRLFG